MILKRNYIIDIITDVFTKYGYLEIQTPSFEKRETLSGKYGNEGDRLIFNILNSGEKVRKADIKALNENKTNEFINSISEKALRYDLTVPLARYVSQHQNEIKFPFRRFQIQNVWRADRPQKGRYQEFTQCDADVIGSDSTYLEYEMIQMYSNVFKNLGFQKIQIKVNHREILSSICRKIELNDNFIDFVTILDKLNKIGSEKVIYELQSFEVPMTPQFLTEEVDISSNEYFIDWANFQGADSYQLFENDVLIYQGDENSYLIQNQIDNTYQYQINAIMPSGHTVVGEIISLDVFHIVEPPLVFNLFTSQQNEGTDVFVSWSSTMDAAWYSLIVEDSDGVVIEMYNGSENFTSLDELNIGQNRIRIQVGLSNGKVSDFSDSIFVNIIEESESDYFTMSNILIFMVSLLSLVTIYSYRNRED